MASVCQVYDDYINIIGNYTSQETIESDGTRTVVYTHSTNTNVQIELKSVNGKDEVRSIIFQDSMYIQGLQAQRGLFDLLFTGSRIHIFCNLEVKQRKRENRNVNVIEKNGAEKLLQTSSILTTILLKFGDMVDVAFDDIDES